MVNKRVSAKRFVEVWQESKSAKAAAEKLGLPRIYTCVRASQYRKMGVPLKRFKAGRRGLPKEALEVLINLAKETRHD